VFSAASTSGDGLLSTLLTLTGQLAAFVNSAQGAAALLQIFDGLPAASAGLLPILVALGQAIVTPGQSDKGDPDRRLRALCPTAGRRASRALPRRPALAVDPAGDGAAAPIPQLSHRTPAGPRAAAALKAMMPATAPRRSFNH
jgi:hypothetical protein